MKGYTIQHSIDLLEEEVKNKTGGASTAAEVSYDNTDSGLTADNVQAAIDEVNGKIPAAPAYVDVVIDFENITVGTNQSVKVGEFTESGSILSITGAILESGTYYAIPNDGLRVVITSDGDVKLNAQSTSSWSITSGNVVIRYIPTTVSTRKRKK